MPAFRVLWARHRARSEGRGRCVKLRQGQRPVCRMLSRTRAASCWLQKVRHVLPEGEAWRAPFVLRRGTQRVLGHRRPRHLEGGVNDEA